MRSGHTVAVDAAPAPAAVIGGVDDNNNGSDDASLPAPSWLTLTRSQIRLRITDHEAGDIPVDLRRPDWVFVTGVALRSLRDLRPFLNCLDFLVWSVKDTLLVPTVGVYVPRAAIDEGLQPRVQRRTAAAGSKPHHADARERQPVDLTFIHGLFFASATLPSMILARDVLRGPRPLLWRTLMRSFVNRVTISRLQTPRTPAYIRILLDEWIAHESCAESASYLFPVTTTKSTKKTPPAPGEESSKSNPPPPPKRRRLTVASSPLCDETTTTVTD